MRGARAGRFPMVPFLLLSAPVLLVPVWFELFSAHTQIHVHFAYRYVPLVLSVVLWAAVTVADAHRARPALR